MGHVSSVFIFVSYVDFIYISLFSVIDEMRKKVKYKAYFGSFSMVSLSTYLLVHSTCTNCSKPS